VPALRCREHELLLADRALLINVVCWICAVLLIIYGTRLE